MKIHIAGITIQKIEGCTNKVNALTTHLKKIYDESLQISGKDAIVIIALEEYALTPTAINHDDKNQYLHILQQAVNHFPNMILIPGSMIYQKKLSEEKKQQLQLKYSYFYREECKKQESEQDLQVFKHTREMIDVLKKTDLNNPKYVYSNSAYLLSKDNPHFTHKKSKPYSESKKLKNQQNCIYDIGTDKIIKNIVIDDNNIDIGLIICYEHNYITKKTLEIKESPPFIQIIISASINTKPKNLFGAINIHMDKSEGLHIYTDKNHKKYSELTSIQATSYQISDKNNIQSKLVTINDIHDPVISSQQDNTNLLKLFQKILNSSFIKTMDDQQKPNEKPKKKATQQTTTTNSSHNHNYCGLRKGWLN